jgi:N-acyl homoserine lactone hydrolase
MLDRRGFLTGLAAAGGCGLSLPPPPEKTAWSWAPDRASLPDVSVRALHVATVQMTEKQTVNGGKDKTPRTAPITVYVLEHPKEGLIVVDTGYGRRTVADPLDYPGRLATKVLDLEMRDTLADRLGDIGRSIGDVKHALITHLHHDHAGGIEDLPASTKIWVSDREWHAGDERHPIEGYDPLPYGRREPSLIPFVGSGPYGPFTHHADLFGDGSIIALDTPGHTLGHVCWLINRPTKSYLIAGDAAWVDRNWQEPAPVGPLAARILAWDWKMSYAQLWRINEWVARHPELTVLAGHEPANLERLPAWPATFT